MNYIIEETPGRILVIFEEEWGYLVGEAKYMELPSAQPLQIKQNIGESGERTI